MTSLVERDTAEPIEQDTAPEEQPETPENLAPETDAEETPETPPESPPRPLEELSDEELAQHERVTKIVKDQVAREEESKRRRTEHETQQRNLRAARDAVASGRIRESLNQHLSQIVQRIEAKIQAGEPVDSSERAIQQQVLESVNNYYFWNAYGEVADQWVERTEMAWPKDAPKPEKLIELAAQVKAGKRDAVGEHIDAFLEQYKEAAIQAELPKLKERWLKEQRESQKAADKNARARAADSTETVEPSGRSGDAVTPEAFEAVLGDMSKPIETRRQAFKSLHGIDPPW